MAEGFLFLCFFSSAACHSFLAAYSDHAFLQVSVARLSFSSLDSLLRYCSARSFSCFVISVGTFLWSVFMCVSLSALILKVFRHSLQMKMCLSVMCLSSSLFVLNPSTHSLHGKYVVHLASASAFSFFCSLCSNLSSLRLWVCGSCSPGWSPPCFSLMCSSNSSAVGETS